MQVRGYMVEAEWDGQTLVARGTSKAGTVALLGAEYGVGGASEMRLPRDEVASVVNVPPKVGGLVNGEVVVTSTAGRTYRMHYRRRDAQAWAGLVAALS